MGNVLYCWMTRLITDNYRPAPRAPVLNLNTTKEEGENFWAKRLNIFVKTASRYFKSFENFLKLKVICGKYKQKVPTQLGMLRVVEQSVAS